MSLFSNQGFLHETKKHPYFIMPHGMRIVFFVINPSFAQSMQRVSPDVVKNFQFDLHHNIGKRLPTGIKLINNKGNSIDLRTRFQAMHGPVILLVVTTKHCPHAMNFLITSEKIIQPTNMAKRFTWPWCASTTRDMILYPCPTASSNCIPPENWTKSSWHGISFPQHSYSTGS